MDLKTSLPLALFLFCAPLWADTKPLPSAESVKDVVDQIQQKWQQAATPLDTVEPQLPQDATDLRRLALRDCRVDSLDVVATPLTAVLDLINDEITQSGVAPINFVVVGGVDPEITVTLKQINAEDAIGLILEGTGLVYELKGSAVLIHPQAIKSSVETRYYPMSQSLLNRIIGVPVIVSDSQQNPLGFDKERAEASLRSFFEQMGVSFGEGSGLALASGELVVSLPASQQERVAELLGRFGKQQQVEIEAKFLEVSEGALEELGVQWNITNSSGSVQIGTTGVGESTSNSLRTLSSAFSSTSTTSTSAPDIPGTLNLAEGASDLADVTKTWGNTSVNGILRALSQEDGTELLSAPRVTVLSGATATLTVAQELRYPQSYDRVNTDVGSGSYSSGSIITAPTPLDFTTRNVGVELKVNPIVEADGSITLNLEPQVTQFERFVDYGGESVVVNDYTTESIPSGFYQPVFNVRKVTTQVNIPNSGTVLMGGLTRSESKTVHDKVPLLGDLPLVGKAFRHEGTSTEKKNLVIFVTARLVG